MLDFAIGELKGIEAIQLNPSLLLVGQKALRISGYLNGIVLVGKQEGAGSGCSSSDCFDIRNSNPGIEIYIKNSSEFSPR